LLKFIQDKLQAREKLEDDNRQTLFTSELLKSEINYLEMKCIQPKDCLLAKLNTHEESRFEMEVDFWIEIESLRETYKEKLKRFKFESKKTNSTLRQTKSRLQNLIKTHYRYCTTI